MLRAMCLFKTAPRFSELVLRQQTWLVGQNQMGHPLPVPLVLLLVPACHLIPLVPALGSCSLWNRLEPHTYFSSFYLHVRCENFSGQVCIFWFAAQNLTVTISRVASWVASSVSINFSEISLLAQHKQMLFSVFFLLEMQFHLQLVLWVFSRLQSSGIYFQSPHDFCPAFPIFSLPDMLLL